MQTTYIFLGLSIFSVFFFFIPLIWLFHYRKWYIVKQRNFTLTFIGGIATFIFVFFNLVTQAITIPCALSYYSVTVFLFIMELCFISRAIRLILLYKLNVFKVTELSQEKFNKKIVDGVTIEPNIYYKSMYKLVDKRLVRIWFIIFIFLDVLICAYFHYNSHSCSFTQFVNINERMNGTMPTNIPSNNNFNNKIPNSDTANIDRKDININSWVYMAKMFKIPEITTLIFAGINFIIACIFSFSNIKDNQKFGIKFDCFSNAIVLFILKIIQIIITNEYIMNKNLLEKINYITKNGRLIFVLAGFYIQTTSVIIPLIKCIKAERINKKHENEPTNTLQYFYKILNSPNLLEELKTIAIQEFSVENILFWENYCILRKYAIRISKKQNCNTSFSNYKYDEINNSYYCLQDTYSHSSSSQDDANYNPSFPLVSQLKPYYNSFYNTFIDINGPASVNITGNTMRRIYHGFYTYPTVGIFDEAKDEVVESMYFSLFPILLQQNWKQLGEIR